MPTIGVEKNAFLAGIGRTDKVTQEELENLFFDMGLELDDIEEENNKDRVYYFTLEEFVLQKSFLYKKNKNKSDLRQFIKSTFQPIVTIYFVLKASLGRYKLLKGKYPRHIRWKKQII